jgi:hypothetical protein
VRDAAGFLRRESAVVTVAGVELRRWLERGPPPPAPPQPPSSSSSSSAAFASLRWRLGRARHATLPDGGYVSGFTRWLRRLYRVDGRLLNGFQCHVTGAAAATYRAGFRKAVC